MRTALEHEVERLVERVLRLEHPEAAAGAGVGEGLWAEGETGLRGAQAAAARLVAGDDLALGQVASLGGLDVLAFFESAGRAVGDRPGRVAVLADVVVQRRCGDLPGPPAREHLLAVAARGGWQLARTLDVTAPMLAFREALDAAILQHQRELRRSGRGFEPAHAALRQRAAALRDGASRGEAFWFERAAAPDFGLVEITPERSMAMRRLFASVFGHPMSAEHWQWKYERGGAHAVALEQRGELVAHYGGLTRELRVFGRPALGCQICDVMVTPEANRSLTRRGPMQQVAATFLERTIGWGLPHEFGFGFPSALHHRLAERLELYVAADRIVQVSWPAGEQAARRWHLERVRLQEGAVAAGPRRAIERLWRQMAEAMNDVALGVRDPRWVRWRYLERPEVEYDVHLVCRRWTRRALGLVVTRRRDDALELIDLVAPPRAFSLLVEVARGLAAAAGRPVLRCWITASQRHRLAGADAAAQRVEELEIVVPANRHTPGLDPATLQNRWFLLAGDADFT